MSERDLRDGLAFALNGEPPLSFDPDAVVARAKRERRRRRSLAGVGVATALIAIAAVAVPGLLHTGGGAGVADQPAARHTSAPAEHVWPPAQVRLLPKRATELHQLAAGWSTELRQYFADHVPSATGFTVQPWGGESTGSVQSGQTYLDTFATFAVRGAASGLYVQVEAPGRHTTSPARDCADEAGSRCQITWHGDSAVVVDSLTAGAGRIVTVTQYRSDGSVVRASGYNYDPDQGPGHPTSAGVPLTVAQLTAIAEDPALSF
jgi:hypothetical protein